MIYELKKRLFKKISDWGETKTFRSACKLRFLTKVSPFKDPLYFGCCMKILSSVWKFLYFSSTASISEPFLPLSQSTKLHVCVPLDWFKAFSLSAKSPLQCSYWYNNHPVFHFFFLDGPPRRAICSTICLGDTADIFTGLPHFHFTKSPFPGTQKTGISQGQQNPGDGVIYMQRPASVPSP